MRFSWNWLLSHLETSRNAQEISHIMDRLGIAVENLWTKKSHIDSNVVTARVVESAPIKGSKRLKNCLVNDGDGYHNVVCGAGNVRPGIIVAYARPGSNLSGLSITKRVIYGIESSGMICSEEELCIGYESVGIVEFDNVEIGVPLNNLESNADHIQPQVDISDVDYIFNVLTTTDRPDLLSVRGIARELALAGAGVLRPIPKFYSHYASSLEELFHPDLKSFYDEVVEDDSLPEASSIAYIDIVSDPEQWSNWSKFNWLYRLLAVTQFRPGNLLVDIGNFILLDLGRPIHIYDHNSGNDLKIVALPEQSLFYDIHNKEHKLPQGSLVAVDGESPEDIVCLLGVIGGKKLACKKNTIKIAVESFTLDNRYIGQFVRKAELLTPAQLVFERGVDPRSYILGAYLYQLMIQDVLGKRVVRSVLKVNHRATVSKSISITKQEMLDIGRKAGDKSDFTVLYRKVEDTLSRIGAVKISDTEYSVPSYRVDLNFAGDIVQELMKLDIMHDATEEADIELYPIDFPPMSLITKPIGDLILTSSADIEKLSRLSNYFCSCGMDELITMPMISSKIVDLVPSEFLKPANPVSLAQFALRNSLIPSMLQYLDKDYVRYMRTKYFEIGTIFSTMFDNDYSCRWKCNSGLKVQEQDSIAIMIFEPKSRMSWRDNFSVSIFDIKEIIHGLLGNTVSYKDEDNGYFHYSSALLDSTGRRVGYIGEVNHKLISLFGIDTRAFAAEISLEFVLNSAEDSMRTSTSEASPSSTRILNSARILSRDISFLVPYTFDYNNLDRAILRFNFASHDVNLICSRLIDMYKMPDKMSLCVNFLFSSANNISGDKINCLIADITKSICGDLGIQARA